MKTAFTSRRLRFQAPRGFTLIELLVVIAIIGVFVAMVSPAIQATRESARRSQCAVNLAQLATGLQNYEMARENYPPGVEHPEGPFENTEAGSFPSWTTRLLPYIDEGNLYRSIDFTVPVYDAKNKTAREAFPLALICPSAPDDLKIQSDYAGCHHDDEAPIAVDNRGVFFLNSHVRRDDVTDGLAYTLFVGEKLRDPDDLGWMSGTRATLRNAGQRINAQFSLPLGAPQAGVTGPLGVGGFGSYHPTIAQFIFGDGSVRAVEENIDQTLFRQLAARADGSLIPPGSLSK